jgi:hypothetical protein
VYDALFDANEISNANLVVFGQFELSVWSLTVDVLELPPAPVSVVLEPFVTNHKLAEVTLMVM